MKLKAYAIYDNKAAAFGRPFFQSQDGQATRMLADLVNDNSTTIFKHPEDYSVYRIGSYNDENGELIKEAPAHLANAIVFIKDQKDQPVDLTAVPIGKMPLENNKK